MRLNPSFPQSTRLNNSFKIALLISALVHGAVLIWVEFDYPDSGVPIAVPVIDVSLITNHPDEEPASDLEPTPELEAPAPVLEIPPIAEESSSQPKNAIAQTTTQPVDSESVESSDPIDWEVLTSTYLEETTIRDMEQEVHRDAMWRKTFSVMFAPPDNNWVIEDDPFLPDLQFESDKPKRLGIKISDNCYLGLGIDPQTVDTDAPSWSGRGIPQATANLISCDFGN